MSAPAPCLCDFCKHLRQRIPLPGAPEGMTDNGIPTCTVFPRGIPAAFWTGRKEHTKPYPGDGGIRFEPVDTGDLKGR